MPFIEVLLPQQTNILKEFSARSDLICAKSCILYSTQNFKGNISRYIFCSNIADFTAMFSVFDGFLFLIFFLRMLPFGNTLIQNLLFLSPLTYSIMPFSKEFISHCFVSVCVRAFIAFVRKDDQTNVTIRSVECKLQNPIDVRFEK